MDGLSLQDIKLFNLSDSLESEVITHGDFEGLLAYGKLPKAGLMLQPVDMQHWLAIKRENVWWVEPAVGKAALKDIELEAYMFLYQKEDGTYILTLPLPDGEAVSAIKIAADGLYAHQRAYQKDQNFKLLITVGDEAFSLLEQTFALLSDHLKTFKLRKEKITPPTADKIGWCTWDAFYQDVTEKKILAGLEHWQQQNFTPGWLLIDDGWADVQNNRMCDFDTDTQKFPNGLAETLDLIKQDYHIPHVGVWHTLQGYWHGLDLESELAEQYGTQSYKTKSMLHLKRDEEKQLHVVNAKDVQRFYMDFYKHLHSAGVDFVKVDNQAGTTESLAEEETDAVSLMKATQHALQSSAAYYFNNGLINCMCNVPEVAYNTLSSQLWRNTNDFWPKRPESHQWHLVMNTYNALWSSHFSVPDWDMFWSAHEAAEAHALARAISGGPVYVSDKPEQSNVALIRKLCLNDGSLLKCDRPAMPARDTLFNDPYNEDKLLKTTNITGNAGLLALFHAHWNEDEAKRRAINDTFSPSDIHDLKGDEFAVYWHNSGELLQMRYNDTHPIKLEFGQAELCSFVPIQAGIAALGLLDKFNSPAAVNCLKRMNNLTYFCELKAGGQIGFYSQRKPKKVTVNDEPIQFHYNGMTRFLMFNYMSDEAVNVVLSY